MEPLSLLLYTNFCSNLYTSGGVKKIFGENDKSKVGWELYRWFGDIYGGVGIEFNVIGDSLGIKLAEPLKIPSLLYTKI